MRCAGTLTRMSTTDQLAAFAIRDIETGMTIGLGTGKAATRAIHALADRVKAESMNIRCVSTSDATTTLAKSLGLQIVEFEDVDMIDLLFDGADEVDPNMVMLKGRGGALTREKIIAHASERRIYLVQKAKIVDRIGQTGTVPIEVMPLAMNLVINELGEYNLECTVRSEGGNPVLTDNGGHILEMELPAEYAETTESLLDLSLAIKHIPGVIEHGIFIEEADAVLVEGESDEDLELYLREDDEYNENDEDAIADEE